jgi:hypothetical protein
MAFGVLGVSAGVPPQDKRTVAGRQALRTFSATCSSLRRSRAPKCQLMASPPHSLRVAVCEELYHVFNP